MRTKICKGIYIFFLMLIFFNNTKINASVLDGEDYDDLIVEKVENNEEEITETFDETELVDCTDEETYLSDEPDKTSIVVPENLVNDNQVVVGEDDTSNSLIVDSVNDEIESTLMVVSNDTVSADSIVNIPAKFKEYLLLDGFTFKEGKLYYNGIELDENGMYVYTDVDGKKWYYDPLDPEFDKHFGTPEGSKMLLRSSALRGADSDGFSGNIDGRTYQYPSSVKGMDVTCGIDVSYFQGSINWNELKNKGIEFVFIRVGYSTLNTGTLKQDPMFSTYIDGAYSAGLKIGIYFFSQAINESEAISEAQFCHNMISSYKSQITLPVIMDYEYGSNTSRMKIKHNEEADAGLDYREIHTSVVNSYCRTIASHGFISGVYANRSMLNTMLNVPRITDEYYIWLANYATSTPYSERLSCWQYRSDYSGFGSSIGSSTVDMDFWFGDLPGENTPKEDTSIEDSTFSYIYNGVDYSLVFDPDYYSNKYSDLNAAFGNNKTALFNHFLTLGMKESRMGNASFDVQIYRYNYDDLYKAYKDDISKYYAHYCRYGKQEGRIANRLLSKYYSPVFDPVYYRNNYSDLSKAFGYDYRKLLDHFISYGMMEGRMGRAEFNVQMYRYNYNDLYNAYGSDLKKYYIHYCDWGKKEGRVCDRLISIYYSPVFDPVYYRDRYSDLSGAYGNDYRALLNHFINYGMREGRQAIASFNVYKYKNRYQDLRNAYGNDLKKYYIHYCDWGKKEGRQAN